MTRSFPPALLCFCCLLASAARAAAETAPESAAPPALEAPPPVPPPPPPRPPTTSPPPSVRDPNSAPDEPPGAAAGTWEVEPPIDEPPLPSTQPYVALEPPPPPPLPRHVAPRTSLWLGARLGWFFPFGNIYAQGTNFAGSYYYSRQGIAWRDYSSSGPLFEADVGARLARNYSVFGLWEHADLGAGSGDQGLLPGHGSLKRGNTDYWGAALRATTDPDHVGFVTEVAVGYRRARAGFADGSSLELTQGVFEGRLGFGADVRINPYFTLSPMLTFGVGVFGRVDFVDAHGVTTRLIGPYDSGDGHAWITLHLGGHFDLFGRK